MCDETIRVFMSYLGAFECKKGVVSVRLTAADSAAVFDFCQKQSEHHAILSIQQRALFNSLLRNNIIAQQYLKRHVQEGALYRAKVTN